MYRTFGKRLLDILLSLAAMIVLSPVLLVVAILVRTKLGSPVLFSQDRPGLHGKVFRLYKFRSMTNAVDSEGNPLPDADRLTRFGRLLRTSSLDELPELWNILKGEMSVVGPRPLLVQYLPYYTEEERRRHDVRPGLTGLAQVNGRNALSWEEKFAYDTQYTRELSFSLDMSILFRTVRVVLFGYGVGEQGLDVVEFDQYIRESGRSCCTGNDEQQSTCSPSKQQNPPSSNNDNR